MRDRPREEQTAVTDSSSETRRGASTSLFSGLPSVGSCLSPPRGHRGARGGRSRLRLVRGHHRRRNRHRSGRTDSLPQSSSQRKLPVGADDSLRQYLRFRGADGDRHRHGRIHYPFESLRRAAAGISRGGVGGPAQDRRHPGSRRGPATHFGTAETQPDRTAARFISAGTIGGTDEFGARAASQPGSQLRSAVPPQGRYHPAGNLAHFGVA